jgi:hypothetical protein
MKRFFNLLRNSKGSIFILSTALVGAFVALASSASLLLLAKNDTVFLSYQMDMLQENLLIRSELIRSDIVVRLNKDNLSDRIVTVKDGDFHTQYTVQTELSKWTIDSNLRSVIRTLVTARRGSETLIKTESPIKRYNERVIQKRTLAQFQYFTESEESENADGGAEAARVKFWGPDVLYGPVHSNSDIWIQQAGGGDNQGWPTFWDSVTTTGIFKRYPNGEDLEANQALMQQIFRGGWKSNARYWGFNATADDIHKNALRPFEGDDDIVYVKISGSSYESWLGKRRLLRTQEFKVYSWYPANAQQAIAVINAGGNWFEDSDHVWTNYIPIYDTLWIRGPSGVINNQSVYTEKELWIEGIVGGKQTWCSADTVFIVGDIYYENTPYLDNPDGNGSSDENPTDMFGLVSEQKILMRYKHTDPESGMRLSPNLNNLVLYGAYAAIAQGSEQQHGPMACHFDGIFTFEYHHQHGSTPSFRAPSPYTGADTLFFLPDLHKYIFPPSNFVPDQIRGFNLHGGAAAPTPLGMCGYPYESPAYLNSYPNNAPYVYPYGTDYPWYNPVWPESAVNMQTIPTNGYLERGDLHIFGAIAQRRRGFIHRSGTDAYNHPNESIWNLESYHFDGFHPPVGYDKNYRFDDRFRNDSPPDFPRIYEGFGEANFVLTGEAWVFKTPPKK